MLLIAALESGFFSPLKSKRSKVKETSVFLRVEEEPALPAATLRGIACRQTVFNLNI